MVRWLAEGKRGPNSIEDFLKHPRTLKRDPGSDDDSNGPAF